MSSAADAEQALRDAVAAIERELATLTLEKAHRDRRLELNALLEKARAKLAAAEARRTLEEAVARLEAKIAALGDGPADRVEKKPLSRELERLRAELAGLGQTD